MVSVLLQRKYRVFCSPYGATTLSDVTINRYSVRSGAQGGYEKRAFIFVNLYIFPVPRIVAESTHVYNVKFFQCGIILGDNPRDVETAYSHLCNVLCAAFLCI